MRRERTSLTGYRMFFNLFASLVVAVAAPAIVDSVLASGATGAVYFEGEFSEGRPDGIVRVEEPGRKSRVRRFRDGKDAGAASAEGLRPVHF